MKNCTHCKYAEWQRTDAGRLHPSGDGKCTYVVTMPKLPACMYWGTFAGKAPEPNGGYINRREDLRDHCPTYQRAEQ